MSNPRDVLVRLGELGKHQDPDTLYRAAVDRARRLRRRRHLLEAAVPVAVVVALLLVWVTRPSSGERVHTSPSPSSSTGTVSANDLSPAISQPTAIAVSDGHVWVTGYAPGNGPATVFDFDASSRKLLGQVGLHDNSPFAMAATTSGVWLRAQQDEQSTSLVKIDPATHTVALTVALRWDGGLAVTDTDVWAVDGDRLLDVDAVTGATRATVPLTPGGYGPIFVTAGPTGVWLTNPYDNTVWKVDTTTHQASVFTTLAARAGPIVQTATTLWVNTGSQLVGLDPNDPSARTTIDLGGIQDMALNDTTIWAVTGAGLYRIDTNTGSVTAASTPPLLTTPTFVATDQRTGAVWTATLRPPAIQPAS